MSGVLPLLPQRIGNLPCKLLYLLFCVKFLTERICKRIGVPVPYNAHRKVALTGHISGKVTSSH